MNYDLREKLKDGGYPFNWKNEDTSSECNYPFHEEVTLSELIKECGDRFASLNKNHQYGMEWVAREFKLEGLIGFGSTPEEAVSLLWLELNKK